jgi:hypothetical protein
MKIRNIIHCLIRDEREERKLVQCLAIDNSSLSASWRRCWHSHMVIISQLTMNSRKTVKKYCYMDFKIFIRNNNFFLNCERFSAPSPYTECSKSSGTVWQGHISITLGTIETACLPKVVSHSLVLSKM